MADPTPPPHSVQTAFDYAPVGLVVTDPTQPDNPAVYVNREFTAITGYQPHEILGRNMRVMQGPDTDAKAVADVRAAIAATQPVAVDLLNYRRGGEPFWARMDARPVFDPAGRLVAFVAAVLDVTASRQAEDRIRENEERLRAFTEAIPLPMLTVGVNGTVARANAAAHEVLGVAEPGLVGRPVAEFRDPDDPSGENMCENLRLHGGTAPTEIKARRADGGELWLLASARLFTVRGETRYVLVFQDVTALKRKERDLTEANEEAERNIRARMRFLAAASHDLRQPLQAMALFASALDQHVSSAQGRTIVASLKTSLRGMEEMFDSLLDMSKLDAGVLKAEPRAFPVMDLFEQLETTYAPQAEAAGLAFRVVPSSLSVHSDPRLLERILGNLLSNAIRYTRKGKILLGVCRRGRHARVLVLDTGPGIPEDKRLEIFREFRQLEGASAGRGQGSGLGLSIVQRLARLLSHPVNITSEMGKGTCFSVTVPVAEEEWAPEGEDEDEEASLPRLDGTVVAVLDDDSTIREGLHMILEDWGCRPVVGESTEDVRGQLGQTVPDAILADLHLGSSQSGIAAIAELRQAAGTAIPALVFTGDTGALEPLEDGGATRVLRKPLDPMRLRLLLAEMLGRA